MPHLKKIIRWKRVARIDIEGYGLSLVFGKWLDEINTHIT